MVPRLSNLPLPPSSLSAVAHINERVYIFKTAKMLYNNEESEGMQQQKKKVLEYKKKEMPSSNCQLAFSRGSMAKKHRISKNVGIGDWALLPKRHVTQRLVTK